MKSKIICVYVILMIFIGCKPKPIDCSKATIEIENRWYRENGGREYLKLKGEKDIQFICDRVNFFSDVRDMRLNYNYGYLTIFVNNRKIDMIFTVNKGVLYSVGPGEYVYDEELTKKIMYLMKIKKRCWRKDCD